MSSDNDVWDFYGANAEIDRASLGEGERGILAILDLRQEAGSGGFDSYFRYWGGDTAVDALAALPLFFGEEWAAVLGEAMDLFGAQYPSDADVRSSILDEGAFDDQLRALGERFYALEGEGDADARLGEALAGLPSRLTAKRASRLSAKVKSLWRTT